MPDSGVFKLTIRQGPKPNQVFELDKDVVGIGREAGNDLVLEDPQISRRHARFTRQSNSYLLEDLGSTNGTFVNGSRVTTPVLLANGDLIGLADTIVIAVQLPIVADPGATLVGHVIDTDSTSVAGGPPPTQPAFTAVKPSMANKPVYVPSAPILTAPLSTAQPLPPAPEAAPVTDNRRMFLIGCGCLLLLAIVALLGLVAWSFIDCGSFSGVFKFLFPPFQC